MPPVGYRSLAGQPRLHLREMIDQVIDDPANRLLGCIRSIVDRAWLPIPEGPRLRQGEDPLHRARHHIAGIPIVRVGSLVVHRVPLSSWEMLAPVSFELTDAIPFSTCHPS